MTNKLSLVLLMALILIGGFGALQIVGQLGDDVIELDKKKIKVVVQPRAEKELAGLIAVPEAAAPEEDLQSGGDANMNQVRSSETVNSSQTSDDQLTANQLLEDRAAQEAFYEEQDRNRDPLEIQKLREAGDANEKFLILSDEQGEGLNNDPDMIARMQRLTQQAEEAEKLLPLILGNEYESLSNERNLEIEELRKKADADEKYLPELTD